jgi:hypothetical protein
MSNEKFEARYQVADGYAGGARPQYFKISAGDLEEDMTDDDLARFYEDAVLEDFQQRISPESERVDAFVAWAREQIAKREQE